MRRRGKVDNNQGAIVAALRALGCRVLSLANVGGGVPDLLVLAPGKTLMLMEIKNDDMSPSKRKLRQSQLIWHREWRDVPYVVESVDEAIAAVNDATRKGR